MVKLNKKYLKPFKNFYVIGLITFVIWMLFFDAHSWLLHNDLNKDTEALEDEKKYYKNLKNQNLKVHVKHHELLVKMM